MTSTRIVLIRHGEAQTHVDGVVGGSNACNGLSDLGRKQAEALRDRVAATGELAEVDALYASTLPRASETARIIAPALGGLDVVERHDLREIDPGEADGLTWAQHSEFFSGHDDPHSPFVTPVPGAESWATFGARVGAAFEELARKHRGQSIVIACHGGVIEHSFTVFHSRGLGGWVGGVRIKNCGITEWEHEVQPYEPWVKPGTWTLVRHNDHSHVPG